MHIFNNSFTLHLGKTFHINSILSYLICTAKVPIFNFGIIAPIIDLE